MEIVVNDTNILIDLCEAGLLKHCRSLSLRFYTLDVIMAEIENENQRRAVDELVADGTLKVESLSGDQMEVVMNKVDEFDGLCNLSPEDISVMIYAKENGYRLLTGDKTLRTKAIMENVKVSGILYLIDKMVDEGIVDKVAMADILELLLSTNKRLPMKIIRAKIIEYRETNGR